MEFSNEIVSPELYQWERILREYVNEDAWRWFKRVTQMSYESMSQCIQSLDSIVHYKISSPRQDTYYIDWEIFYIRYQFLIFLKFWIRILSHWNWKSFLIHGSLTHRSIDLIFVQTRVTYQYYTSVRTSSICSLDLTLNRKTEMAIFDFKVLN